MKKKTLAFILQLPALIAIVLVPISAFYIKIFKPDVLSMFWATPITILLFSIAYFWGRKLEKSPYPY